MEVRDFSGYEIKYHRGSDLYEIKSTLELKGALLQGFQFLYEFVPTSICVVKVILTLFFRATTIVKGLLNTYAAVTGQLINTSSVPFVSLKLVQNKSRWRLKLF